MTTASSLDVKHPLYTVIADDWQLMMDSLSETATKKAGVKYLPATRAMRERGLGTQGRPGEEEYQSYKTRAIFYEIVSTALEAMVGLLNKKPITVQAPKALEPMFENYTKRGNSIYDFNRKLNEAQLLLGRIGLLTDVPANAAADAMPYTVPYDARNIINWDDAQVNGRDRLMLTVLNESRRVFDPNAFSWDTEQRYKMLFIDPQTNRYAVVDEVDGTRSELILPSLAGNQLDEIPFVFCGSNDLDATPDKIPLLSLARMSMAIYRGEADYRQSLFLQGQDTLVTKGGSGKVASDPLAGDANGHVNVEDYAKEPEIEVGAGARIHLPADGDAKFIGVESKGLEEQREAQNDLHKRADQLGGQLMSNIGNQKEAAEAIRLRLRAHTSSLTQVALTGAQALEMTLKHAAMFKGLNPDEVEVTPNLDFDDIKANADEINKLIDAKIKGAVLSQKSIHKVMVSSGVTEMSYEEEIEEIENEDDILIPRRGPNQPGFEPGQQEPGQQQEPGSEEGDE